MSLVRHGTDKLPPELWRPVFRYATALPSSYSDSPTLALPRSEYKALPEQVKQSYATKRALSETCRVFHEIAIEVLYEVLIIERVSRISVLVGLLQQPLGGRTTRGWWCKTLHIHLWNQDQDWGTGRSSLWGLLAACPRVVDLRLSIANYRPTEACGEPLKAHRYHIPVELLQQIATRWGPRLKRLELMGSVTAHIRHLERFMVHCPELEVCRFSHVDRYDLVWSMYLSAGTSKSPVLVEHEDTWSDPAPDRVSLRRLHAFDMPTKGCMAFSNSAPNLFKWDLPSLRTLRTGIDGRPWIPLAEEMALPNLTPHASNIKTFTWQGLPWHFWKLINHLSCLEEVKVPFNMQFVETKVAVAHDHLREIMLDANYDEKAKKGVPNVLQRILRVVDAGQLPVLRRIEVVNLEEKAKSRPLQAVRRQLAGQNVEVGLQKETVPVHVGALDQTYMQY